MNNHVWQYQVVLGSLIIGSIYRATSNGVFHEGWQTSYYSWPDKIRQESNFHPSVLHDCVDYGLENAKEEFKKKLPKKCHCSLQFVAIK